MYFLLQLLYSALLGSLLYFLTVEIVPKCLCSTLKFGEYSYDYFFEFFIFLLP